MQYLLNSRSYNNRKTLKSYQKIFHTGIQILSLTFSLNFQLINFPLYERILLYFSCPRPYNVCNGSRLSFIYHPNSHHTSPMLSFFAVNKPSQRPLGVFPGFFVGVHVVPPISSNPDPISDQKMLQTRLLKPIPVFRPGKGVNTVITFMLELKPETISSKPFRIRSSLFLSDSFGIETIDKYVHTLPGSFLENHTRFQTKMGELFTRFQTKTAQKPYPLGGGGHIPIWPI